MTIYLVDDEYAIEGAVACATLAEARAVARGDAENGHISTVSKVKIGPLNRQGVCDVYNRVNFVLEHVDIERWEPQDEKPPKCGKLERKG